MEKEKPDSSFLFYFILFVAVLLLSPYIGLNIVTESPEPRDNTGITKAKSQNPKRSSSLDEVHDLLK